MTSDEFRDLVSQKSDSELLVSCLQGEATPFVFEPRPAAWDSFRDEITAKLNVGRSDIRVVGSARFGFSLKPGSDLRAFRETSDIDVIVVSPHLFDNVWVSLLAAAYPRGAMLDRAGGWLRKTRNELYTGWLTPMELRPDATIVGSKVQPVLEFRTNWFDALKRAGQHPPRRHEDVQGRLYRTWEHAELYHLDSLAALRRSLQPQDLP